MQSIGTLQPYPPYDFDKLLELLRRFPSAVLNHVHEQTYRRVLHLGEHLALVQVQPTSPEPLLDVTLLTQTAPIDETALLHALGNILALTDDRHTFAHYVLSNQLLQTAIAPVMALPSLRTQTAYEALASAIIEQQISWRGALKAQRWLLEWGGRFLDHEGERWYAHPTPAQIAAATQTELKPLKITDKRIRLLIHVSEQVASGQLRIDDLPPQEAYQRLIAIKGIGHWTAAVALSRAMGSSYVGTNDVALQAAVNWYCFGQEGRASASVLAELFAGFGEHAGRAADLILSRWVIERY